MPVALSAITSLDNSSVVIGTPVVLYLNNTLHTVFSMSSDLL